MIWIILFIVVVVISFILAYRSMKDFKEIPITPALEYGLFLIKNPAILSKEYLEKIHKFSLENKAIISFERLIKGEESVLVIMGPKNIATVFGELGLVELEDYLLPISQAQNFDDPNKVSVNQSLGFVVSAKEDLKQHLTVSPNFLKDLTLEPHQKFFFQIVLSALKDLGNFQVTIRSLVNDADASKRAELAKKLQNHLTESTGLKIQEREETTSKIFTDYQKRALIPIEISKFTLIADEVLGLLTV